MATPGLRIDVTDQPTALTLSDSGDVIAGKGVLVTNRSAVPLDIGDDSVATDAGYQLDPGDSIALTLEHGETTYAVGPDAGPYRVDVLRTGVVR